MPVVLSERLTEVLDATQAGEGLDGKLHQLLERDIRRRLAEYEAIDRRLRQKYGMSLEEFEHNNKLATLGFSFEAENDYHDWDMAIDGIGMLRNELSRLREGE